MDLLVLGIAGANYGSSGQVLSSQGSSALQWVDATNVAVFPSGTRMLFQQTSAPTGWTKVTSGVNNRALRIVTGSGWYLVVVMVLQMF